MYILSHLSPIARLCRFYKALRLKEPITDNRTPSFARLSTYGAQEPITDNLLLRTAFRAGCCSNKKRAPSILF